MKLSGAQSELFATSVLPRGFVHQADFLAPEEAALLVAEIERLPLHQALYRTFTAKRRIVSFGVGYDFQSNRPTPAPPLPAFLHDIRQRASSWAGIAAAELSQCTVAEYSPGTQLGWHRDVAMFGVVVGISLAAPARMRFRPYPHVTNARERALTVALEPGSIYVLRDDARWRWQHAISPTKALRFSLTFRTLRADRPA